MSDYTPEQIVSIYNGALQSVELLKNGEPIGYIGDWGAVESANKQHLELVLAYDCWTTEDLTPLQVASVAESPRNVQTITPTFNVLTQKAIEGYPVKQGDFWVQTWLIVDLTAEEQAAQAQAIQSSIVQATQDRLDTFARTRNYDGILSLCTYATSSVPKFAAEGQYGIDARDNTWATLYQILDEVQAGIRPAPSGYADIEPQLPVLQWPN